MLVVGLWWLRSYVGFLIRVLRTRKSAGSEDLRRLYEVLGNPIIPHCALSASGLEYKLRVLSPQASISFSLRRLHTYTQLR